MEEKEGLKQDASQMTHDLMGLLYIINAEVYRLKKKVGEDSPSITRIENSIEKIEEIFKKLP